jgi:hypothetical protein
MPLINSSRERVAAASIFKVGQIVKVAAPFSASLAGSYKILSIAANGTVSLDLPGYEPSGSTFDPKFIVP